MSGLGLAMFVVAIVLMTTTGLPVYAVLLAVATIFAAIGVAGGAFDVGLLGALPARIVGLLEHDLLQALPLYAFIGALLNRLPLAGLMHAGGERLFARSPASAQLSALGVGALLAPMNGSVGASLHMLARSVAPALAARKVAPAEAAATICVASTLGIVIPPSLVLLLLGDAMLTAHTEAMNFSHAAVRIVNTQDVLRASIGPGLAVLGTALAMAAWRGRGRPRLALPPLGCGEGALALIAARVIALLLGAVAVGRLKCGRGGGDRRRAAARRRSCQRPCRSRPAARGRRRRDGADRPADGIARRGDHLFAGPARPRQSTRSSPTRFLSCRPIRGRCSARCSSAWSRAPRSRRVRDDLSRRADRDVAPVLSVVPDAAWVAALTLLVL